MTPPKVAFCDSAFAFLKRGCSSQGLVLPAHMEPAVEPPAPLSGALETARGDRDLAENGSPAIAAASRNRYGLILWMCACRKTWLSRHEGNPTV